MQAIERGESILENSAGMEMSTSMEKERILNDDPKWNGRCSTAPMAMTLRHECFGSAEIY